MSHVSSAFPRHYQPRRLHNLIHGLEGVDQPANLHRMIPAFTGDGQLPPGRYHAMVAEIEHRFVNTFPTSATRKAIFKGWHERSEAIQALVPVESEWLDGSFVTAKRDPGDVDIVTFIDVVVWNALPVAQQQIAAALIVGPGAKLKFGCDGYFVAVCPDGHPWRDNCLHGLGKWDDWWSHDRTGNVKGYLEVRGS